MKFINIFILLFFFSCATSLKGEVPSRIDWKQDLTFLIQKLKTQHPNLNFKVGEGELEKSVQFAQEKLEDASDPEGLTEIMKVIAKIGDAHTGFELNLSKEGLGQTPRIPIVFKIIGKKVFVSVIEEKNKDLLGLEVIKVGKTPIGEVLEKLKTVISYENKSWLRFRQESYLRMPVVLQGLKVIRDLDQASFKFKKGSFVFSRKLSALKNFKEVSFKSYSSKFSRLRDEQPKELYYYRVLDDETLYLNYRACHDKEKFTVLAEEILKDIDSKKIKKVVIDLRENQGGDSRVAAEFFKRVGMMAKEETIKLITLISYKTMSSAVLGTYDLERSSGGKVVLIGEPTGGKPNHYGNIKFFSLPNSGYIVSCSSRYYTLFKDIDPDSYYPDITTLESKEDFQKGRDRTLEAALKVGY